MCTLSYEKRYNIIFFVTTYVCPMMVMAVCYSRMGRHLWGSEIVGEETPALLKNYRNKKKVWPAGHILGFAAYRGDYNRSNRCTYSPYCRW